MGAPKSKSNGKGGVPIAKYPYRRLEAAKDKAETESEFLLTDPAPTTDDFQEDCLEKSLKMTVCGGLCTNSTDFNNSNLKVHTVSWCIPHLLKVSESILRDDPRGAIVMLKESQLSFKNVSNVEVILHANTPVARLDNPDVIYARASGFRKGNVVSDDMILKPGETLTYSVPWDKMQSNIPITTIKNERLWMNMITFCVEMRNINPVTGTVFPENEEIVTIIPKTRYWKRKSNPIPPDEDLGITIEMQGSENFGFATLGGITDLYTVNPIDAMGGALVKTKDFDGRYVRDSVMFATRPGRVVYCQDAFNEGDLLGIGGYNLGDYTTAQLMVRKRFGDVFEPLQLPSRQAKNIRVLVPGLCISSEDRDPAFSYSYFKFEMNEETGEGRWILWDEDANEPRGVDPGLGIETTMSAFTPLMVLDGLNTPKVEKFYGYYSEFGQPYGDPKGFADFIKTTISVISVISKVATFVGGLI